MSTSLCHMWPSLPWTIRTNFLVREIVCCEKERASRGDCTRYRFGSSRARDWRSESVAEPPTNPPGTMSCQSKQQFYVTHTEVFWDRQRYILQNNHLDYLWKALSGHDGFLQPKNESHKDVAIDHFTFTLSETYMEGAGGFISVSRAVARELLAFDCFWRGDCRCWGHPLCRLCKGLVNHSRSCSENF
jgi:hypothetical protein